MPIERWNLDVLYPSFNQDFKEDLAVALKQSVKLIADLEAGRLNTQKLFDEYEYLATLTAPVDYLELIQMVDTTNDEVALYVEDVAAFRRNQTVLKSAFMRKVGNIPKDATFWEGRTQYQSDCYSIASHLFPSEQENTVRMMQQNGSRAWQSLFNKLDASASADLVTEDGVINHFPLAAIRNFVTSHNGNTRQRAYEAELESYASYQLPMAACLNGVKGEGISLAPLRQFPSVLDQMLHENRMDRLTLDTMFAALKKNLPMFRGYLRRKAALLGRKNGLPYFDLMAPIDCQSVKYSFDETKDILRGVFQEFSPELAQMIDRIFSDNWIDAEPRAGKIGGALCADLPNVKQSRILVNFSGSFSNIRTIAHEIGHAFHGQMIVSVPAIFRDAPTPICESAAIFNETILQQAIQDPVLVDVGLREATQTIVDIYSRYLFEDAVFKIRKERPLSAEDLCCLMHEAQLEAYGDALDPNFTHPYMWMSKPHYYIPDFHYYNFPYIFGLLFAKGLYSLYRRQPDGFFVRYKNFLSQTCAGDVHTSALRIGIDVHDSAFWDEAFAILESEFSNVM